MSNIEESQEPKVQVFRIETERQEPEKQPQRVFYRNMDEHERWLKRAMCELQEFKKRYHFIDELAPIFKAIDELQRTT